MTSTIHGAIDNYLFFSPLLAICFLDFLLYQITAIFSMVVNQLLLYEHYRKPITMKDGLSFLWALLTPPNHLMCVVEPSDQD